jgi:hypothetical protein
MDCPQLILIECLGLSKKVETGKKFSKVGQLLFKRETDEKKVFLKKNLIIYKKVINHPLSKGKNVAPTY